MDPNRYVQLTDSGLTRFESARRKYRTTLDDIAGDRDTPSVNTIKRAFRKGPVFLSTLERIWYFLQRCAEDTGVALPFLVEGEDYSFVDGALGSGQNAKEQAAPSGTDENRRGWISRQVPRPNRLFTGRREILDRLHAALEAGPAALVPDPQALTGLGGIGKTQTAIAYIYKHRNEYARIFWVSAETIEDLNDGLASLAEEIDLLDPAPASKNEALARMHDWFRNESDWLLVLDNVDEIETLAPYFPRHHNGRLLLTTRTRNTVKWAEPISLAEFKRQEGALLLMRRSGKLAMNQKLGDAPEDITKSAMDLSQELGGLPLAINQAGAYLAETTSSVSEYLAMYRMHGLELLDRVRDSDHAAVTITFNLALKQIEKRSAYGGPAVEMVRLCAFLAPDAIPEAIFASYSFEQPGSGLPLLGSDHYDDICAAVCGYSLAIRNPEGKTLTVHRLVQKVTRESLTDKEHRTWTERAVLAVSDATPDFEFEDWALCDLLLPHWRLCAEYIRGYGIEMHQAAYLLYQSGRYLRARALYAEAEDVLQRGLSVAEKVHGATNRITADLLDELACLFRVLDRGRESEPLHERAVEIVEQLEGPDSRQMASKLHNMALFYFQREDYSTAEALFSRSLAIREKHPDRDQMLTAATLTQLAGVYRCLGDFDRAEPHCRRALEMQERLLGPNHIEVATGCNNHALLYLTMGRYAEAEELYLRALKINEQSRGKEHPETGHVIWGLARVRWKQRQISEADELFRRAIGISTKYFGQQHAKVSRLLASYSDFQEDIGRTVKTGA